MTGIHRYPPVKTEMYQPIMLMRIQIENVIAMSKNYYSQQLTSFCKSLTGQLVHEILKRFREKEITIPFPQRDLHLYGLGSPGIENLTENLAKELHPEGNSA